MILPTFPAKPPRVAVESSFLLDSGRLCILELTLTDFGLPDSLSFLANTEGVEVVAAETLLRGATHSSEGKVTAMVALRWRARPSILRLVCRSEKISVALAISNFETTSLPHAVALMDAHRLLALVDILRRTNSGDRVAHAFVMEQIRKLAHSEFFLNWLPAAENRFVCLVMQAGIQDPDELRLHALTNVANSNERLLPVSHSVGDNYIVIMYDLKGAEDPRAPVDVAAVIQEKLHLWRLPPRSQTVESAAGTEHLMRLSARWTDELCEAIAVARSYLLGDQGWQSPEVRPTSLALRQNTHSMLIVTDVVDTYGLTLVMAAAESWKAAYDRIYLLLPSLMGKRNSPAIEPLNLIDNFGGREVLKPITADECDAILRSLEVGMSVSFASAAASYGNPIEERGPARLAVVTFELSSSEQLLFFWKLANYAMSAGGPLVWRELQCALASSNKEGISTPLLSDRNRPSLVDDLYGVPCSSLGWPLRAFQRFDRQMLVTLSSGDAK